MSTGTSIAIAAALTGLVGAGVYQDANHPAGSLKKTQAPATLDVSHLPLTLAVYNQGDMDQAGQKKVSAHFDKAPVTDVIQWLKDNGVNFMIKDSQIPKDATVTLSVTDQPVSDVVSALGDALGGHWDRHGDIYVYNSTPGFGGFGLPGMGGQPFDFAPNGMKGSEGFGKGFMAPMNPGDMKGFMDLKDLKDMPGFGKMDPKQMQEFKKQMDQFQKQMGKNGEGNGFMFQVPPGDKNFSFSMPPMKMDPKQMQEFHKQMEQFQKEMGKNGGKNFMFQMPPGAKGFNFNMPPMKGMPGEPFFQLNKVDFDKLAKSLTPEQKKLMKSRGYLKVSDLSAAQKKMAGISSETGTFSMTYEKDGTKIVIKSGK